MEEESKQNWKAEPRNCTSGQGLGPQEAVTILSCLCCVGLWSLARPQGLPTHPQSPRILGPKNPCSAGGKGASTLPGPLPTGAQNFLQKEKAPGDETVKLRPSGSVPAQPSPAEGTESLEGLTPSSSLQSLFSFFFFTLLFFFPLLSSLPFW